MDFQCLDPTYLTELKAESLKMQLAKMQKKVDEMQRTIDEQNETIAEDKRRIEKFKKKEMLSKFKKATHIERLYCPTISQNFYEGLVISPPIPYQSRNEMNKDIFSFNYVYCPKLGLIRSMNRDAQISMDFGRFYYFKTCDDRTNFKFKRNKSIPELTHLEAARAVKPQRRHAGRKTFIVDDELMMKVYFKLDASMLFSKKSVVLEDKDLNAVHLRTKMIAVIYQAAGKPHIEGPLGILTIVTVKKDFLKLFKAYENNALFEVKEIKVVRFGDGPEIRMSADN